MPLITMRNVNFRFSGPYLLADANFQLDAGQRVCLLGRNGCGKSTFLQLIRGTLEPESGEIIRSNGLRIGMLEQTVPAEGAKTVFDVVAQGLGESAKLLTEYHNLAAGGHNDSKNGALVQLGNKLDQSGAWNKLNVVETVISQIDLDAGASFAELSAGLKRRVMLARALAAEPDVLILDEPTNHLDIEAIDWMEDFVQKTVKTLLFVTHDRRFLKKLATRIIELDRGDIFSYDCDYEQFLQRREQQLAAEQKHRQLFDKKLAQEERWIRQGVRERRKRNQGRVKALIEMRQQRAQRRNLQGLVNIEINQAQRSGDLVVKTSKMGFAYPAGPRIVDRLDTIITRGDRIGIIGPNGSGKTTLLKLLLGELEPTAGSVRLGKNVQCAYFDQLHGRLDPAKSLWENIGQGYDTVTINGRKKHVISYLMDFLFAPEKARLPVSDLSGGEKNRLQIAKIFTQPSNVLILDEPTNDLDIETLELLEEMLIEYPGTVLLVSHDRAFLNNVVTSTLVLEGGGRVGEYAGGYDDWLTQRPDPAQPTVEKAPKTVKKAQKNEKNEKNQPKKLSYMQARQLEELPATIEKLEEQIEILHGKMADPDFYRQPGDMIARAKSLLETLQERLSQAYQQWETLETMNEG